MIEVQYHPHSAFISMMKLTHLIFFLFFCTPFLSAQFGARFQYSHSTITMGHSDTRLSDEPAVYVGVNYWYRLKNIRLEFFPEIGVQRTVRQANVDLPDEVQLFDQINLVGLTLPVQVYPFDFRSDCDCPTFSKQSRTFQKGFFVLGSGGYYFSTANSNASNRNSLVMTLGVGFDLGINDLITISPMVEHVWYRRDQQAELPGVQRGGRAGIRISFRPDYRRRF